MKMDIRLKPESSKCNDKNSYSALADLFLTFSDSTSWLILYSLHEKGMTLSAISKSMGLTPKSVLPVLMALLKKNILNSYTKSQETYYRLADDHIYRALDLIHRLSQRKVTQAESKRRVR